jgi:hypothetical protein
VPEANVSRETIVGALFRRRLRKQDICRRAGQLAPVPPKKILFGNRFESLANFVLAG